jgi:hypothetical protein
MATAFATDMARPSGEDAGWSAIGKLVYALHSHSPDRSAALDLPPR